VIVVLFASRNWSDVTLNLWEDIQADIKLPVLLLIVFLIGFLPTWLILRARIWSNRRRIEAMERNRLAALAPEPGPASASNEQRPVA
jgi:lipopolysaccharide assembly protein A